ncbi:hypothetical protein HU200_067658 [Digitaria exilis]|uniref:Uncharacterized protein n=1 Tax=Digitaria exilis TaxID=1010633 RepID=A0A834ZVE8_9POAL|nr:hypothetical protein HU200_067658 [Digitaria exilis]
MFDRTCISRVFHVALVIYSRILYFHHRPIGAVVFMQRGILKAYGGGGKPSSSSFALRMDEFNTWTSVNSRMVN